MLPPGETKFYFSLENEKQFLTSNNYSKENLNENETFT